MTSIGDLREKNEGELFSRQDYNTIIRTLKEVLTFQSGQGGGGANMPFDRKPAYADYIHVKAFGPVEANSIFNLGDQYTLPGSGPYLNGVVEKSSFENNRNVYMTNEGVATTGSDNNINARPVGDYLITKVQVDDTDPDNTPIVGTVCGIEDDSWKLTKNGVGLFCLKRYDIDSIQYADVIACGTVNFLVKAQGQISIDSIGTFIVQGGTPGSEVASEPELTYEALNKTGEAIDASDDDFYVLLDINGFRYAILASEGGPEGEVKVVNIYNPEATTDTCLWEGRVAIPSDGSSYCNNQFPNDPQGQCWITVLNIANGSTAITVDKIKLKFGDHYIGLKVGTISNVPVYAIRVTDLKERWFKATASSQPMKYEDNGLFVTLTEALDDGELPFTDPIFCRNDWGYTKPGGPQSPCLVVQNRATAEFELVSIKQILYELVYDVEWDQDEHKLIQKKAEFATMRNDFVDDEDILTAVAVETVENVAYSPATRKLTYDTFEHWIFPNQDLTPTEEPVHTMVAKTVVDGVTAGLPGQITVNLTENVVWSNRDISDAFIVLFTTTVAQVVTHIGQRGVNIFEDWALVTVLNPVLGPNRVDVIFGTECPEVLLAGANIPAEIPKIEFKQTDQERLTELMGQLRIELDEVKKKLEDKE